MEMRKRILCTVVVCIIVCIDCLSLEASNSIELLDGSCTKPCQCTEDGTLDLGHLCVLNSIDKSVLGLRCVVLQLLCGIFLPKGCNLVEVHLKIVCHFLCQLIFRSFACSDNSGK